MLICFEVCPAMKKVPTITVTLIIKSVCLMWSGSKLQSSGVATGKHSRSVFITKIILMMFIVLSFQENENFNFDSKAVS